MKILALLLAAACLSGQTVELKSLDRLASKAKNDGTVTVQLQGVTVRHFEFDREGAYADSDLSDVRSQLRGAGWSKMVDVRSKKAGENTEVYVHGNGDKMTGFVVLVAEPRELTVVNILGSLDLGKLRSLREMITK